MPFREFTMRDILEMVEICLYPIVAKAGGGQSQGVKGEAVVIYCDPLVTKDLGASGFPGMVKNEKIIVTPRTAHLVNSRT